MWQSQEQEEKGELRVSGKRDTSQHQQKPSFLGACPQSQQRPDTSSGFLEAAPPPLTSQALFCISCKHGHFLPRKGLAVPGPHPVVLQAQHTMAGQALSWPPHIPDLPPGPRAMPPFVSAGQSNVPITKVCKVRLRSMRGKRFVPSCAASLQQNAK